MHFSRPMPPAERGLSRKGRRLSWAAIVLLPALTLPLSAQAVQVVAPQAPAAPQATLAPEWAEALDRITARSLEGHLFFIASDLLEGRDTPSPGLDIAAEYIAAQFRRAGLEPMGDEHYFQTAHMVSYTDARGRTRMAAPGAAPEGVETEAVTLHNVVGLLRGSDPELADTYVLLTAHYDHVGIGAERDGDSIYNGANDNGSGTVTVIEVATALATLKTPPRRSLLFVAFFGEERGMLGARWYAENPVVPLERTVAALNLEQVGRTDGDGGDQTNRASITGFDFSDFPLFFARAGQVLGVEVYHHPRFSTPYFRASDNIALAQKGIPSHTYCVLFQYDDYHGPGDHWYKIDYPNMARTARVIALGLVMTADSERMPHWNAGHEHTAPYLEAWRRLHGGGGLFPN
jgi:hypothetical protein